MNSFLHQLPAPPTGLRGWPWTEETPTSTYAADRDWPRISIVTPSYNQGAYIEETIRSILLQNYPNLNFVVIDGGSTEGTIEILKKYSPWINHWESERDRGQSHAINKGLSHCDGRWFNWINSDDCLMPGALAAIGRADQQAGIISGAEITGTSLAEHKPLGRTKIGPTLEDTLVNHYICQQGLFFRMEIVRALRGVREDLHYVMDLDLFSRALLSHGLESVVEIPEIIAFFRQHAEAKTSTATHKFFGEERRLAHGIGQAANIDGQVLRYVANASTSIPCASPVHRINQDRLTKILARKFWWDESIEVAWASRDFDAFKREIRAFRIALPDLCDARISKIYRLSIMPNFLLRIMSLLRSKT